MGYAKMLQRVRGESVRESGRMEVGELVRLKSGGPVMVVQEEFGTDGLVHCIWTTREGTVQEMRFEPQLLKRYERTVRRWAS